MSKNINFIFIQILINFINYCSTLDGNIGKNNYGPNINIPGFLCSPTGLPNSPSYSPSSLLSNPYSSNYPLPPLSPSPSSPLQSFYYSPPSSSPIISPPPLPSTSQSNYLPSNPSIMNIPPPPIYGNGYPINSGQQPFGSYFCIPYCPQNGNNFSPPMNNYLPSIGPISNAINPANQSPLGYGINDLGYGISPQMGGGGTLPFSGAYIHTEPSNNNNNIGINGQMANGGNVPFVPLNNNIWSGGNGLRRMVKEANNDETKIENKKVITEKGRKNN